MKILLILLNFLVSAQLWAEPPGAYRQLVIQRIGLGDQLNKRNIKSIVQDSVGFMWIGTTDGLLRFDGAHIRYYKNQKDNPTSLPYNEVRRVITDRKHRLWVATQSGGLSLYNPEADGFSHFTPPVPNEIKAFFKPDFLSIREMPNDDRYLWLTDFDGYFYRFDRDRQEFRQYVVNSGTDRVFSTAHDMMPLSDNLFWVAFRHDGVVVCDSLGNILNKYGTGQGLRSDQVNCIHKDSRGQLWVGTTYGGLHLYRPQTNDFEFFDIGVNPFVSAPHFGDVYSITEDEKKNFWITTNHGLFVFDPVNKQVLHVFANQRSDERSLRNNRTRAVFFDRNGLIWIGNDGGGIHTGSHPKHFHHVVPEPDMPERLNSNIVRAFLEYDERTIWIGTQDGGINVWDRESDKVLKTFVFDGRKPGAISSNDITHFYKAPDGKVWVGTWGKGVAILDPQTGQVRSFVHKSGVPNSLPDDRVQFIKADSYGQIWVGTENGLALFRPATNDFEVLLHNPDDDNSLSYNGVQALAFLEIAEQEFWIGTWNGLNYYNRKTGTFRRFYHRTGEPNTLPAPHIISLYHDGKGTLWMGTFNGGLAKMNLADSSITALAEANGLSNNIVFSILPDKQGNLWLSTNNGLTVYLPATGRFRNFSIEDGLQANEFWWGAALLTKKGEMYFGGNNGFNHFFPEEIAINQHVPPIVISSVEVYGKPLILRSGEPVELDYRNNYFTISYAALDYTAPHKNQYAYRLDGVDKDWMIVSNRQEVSYAFLGPGEYTFRVRGSNNDGVWNEEGVALTIIIHPPLWETWWFRLIAAFCLGMVIYMFFKTRLKRVKLQQARLEQLVAVRTAELQSQQAETKWQNQRLIEQTELLRQKNEEVTAQKAIILQKSNELEAKNESLVSLNEEKNYLMGVVAHDLRSPLNHVKGLLQIISLSPDMKSEERSEILKMMGAAVARGLEMISKILDIRAAENKTLKLDMADLEAKKLTQQIVKEFEQRAAQKNISLIGEWEVSDSDCFRADRQYFRQVLENLISNALKFSKAGTRVTVSLRKEEDALVWCVADQGPGLTPDDMRKLFGKFQKLSAQPTGGEHSTGLGLSIVKEFTEHMQGKVWCESEPGKGARFFVRFLASVATVTG